MDFLFIGILLTLVNAVLSIFLAIFIINKLYISKKFSKEKDFHLYNDLFSWEIFFLIIAIENFMKIVSEFLSINNGIYDLLLRIRILLLYFPFWTKIIHLEKVMNKITYERHYFTGIIPFVMVLFLYFTGLPNIILIYILICTSLIPYILVLIFLRNTGLTKKRFLKVISGVFLIGIGCIFKPEIFTINLIHFTSPIMQIIGTILILNSFPKEMFF